MVIVRVRVRFREGQGHFWKREEEKKKKRRRYKRRNTEKKQ